VIGSSDVSGFRTAELQETLVDLWLGFLQPLSYHLYIIFNYTLHLMNDNEEELK
jgi:hypothetical protein